MFEPAERIGLEVVFYLQWERSRILRRHEADLFHEMAHPQDWLWLELVI